MNTPSIALLGASGQLGKTICEYWQSPLVQNPMPIQAYGREDLDISCAESVESVLGVQAPCIVFNAAAYTAVDNAESDSQTPMAYKVNEDGVRVLGEWCARNHSLLIHVSTDFVFDGEATTPYCPSDETGPRSVYGKSKLAGEVALFNTEGLEAIILRTSWLYSRHGSNFVKTMLRLMAEKSELSVVADQLGSPTSTTSLARLFDAIIGSRYNARAATEYESPTVQCLHWSDEGAVSWYEFAIEIQRLGKKYRLLESLIPIKAITTAEYPTPASRPSYSVLSSREAVEKFECNPQSWNTALERVIEQIADTL